MKQKKNRIWRQGYAARELRKRLLDKARSQASFGLTLRNKEDAIRLKGEHTAMGEEALLQLRSTLDAIAEQAAHKEVDIILCQAPPSIPERHYPQTIKALPWPPPGEET